VSGSLLTRVFAFGGLLLAEYLLVSLLFDAQALRRTHGGALSALGYAGDAATIGLVVLAAVLALMGPSLRDAVVALPDTTRLAAKPLAFVAHAVAYLSFVGVTARLFASSLGPNANWLVAWVVAGLALAVTWIPLALPWPALRALWPRLSGALLIGGCAGLLAWGAGQASSTIWAQLAPVTLSVVAAMLRVVLPDLMVDEATATIGTPAFAVQIAPVCSGFEGIGLILALLGAYMIVERKHLLFPRVLMLLPAAVATVWTANALRIALLIVIGNEFSPQLALGGFHSKAGWLLFSAIALGFIAVARRTRYFTLESEQPGADEINEVAPFLMPLLILLGTGLVTGLVTTDHDHLYALRASCAAAAIWAYRDHYRKLPWGLHWESIAIGVAAFGAWSWIARGADPIATHALEQALVRFGPVWAGLWLVGRALGSALVVPVAEELAFRGYLLRRLVAADFVAVDPRVFAPVAWLASSLAFGVLHRDWAAATIAGLAYALAQQRRGRVTDAIAAHATTNLLLAADALLFHHLAWWA
jgi:exosortase E/protease (VPEID-CTERM system)